MTSRLLIMLNAVGCLLLTAIVVMQWKHERALNAEVSGLNRRLVETEGELTEQIEKREGLEADVAMLKESLGEAKKAIGSREQALLEHRAVIEKLEAEIQVSRERVGQWEEAVAARERQIKSLGEELVATRKRLDEAIGQLKAARNR